MATTRYLFTPSSAEFPSTAAAALGQQSSTLRFTVDFDAGATESKEQCWWTFVVPQGWSGTLSAVISYFMATANTGTIAWNVYLEAMSDGDDTKTDSYDTSNASGGVTVPGTAGLLGQISVTLTNADSLAVGDVVRLLLERDTSTDTATGDARVLTVELREA